MSDTCARVIMAIINTYMPHIPIFTLLKHVDKCRLTVNTAKPASQGNGPLPEPRNCGHAASSHCYGVLVLCGLDPMEHRLLILRPPYEGGRAKRLQVRSKQTG